ncbi:MAG: hypothetical protein AAF235_03075 [Planctomycetota bacterium]
MALSSSPCLAQPADAQVADLRTWSVTEDPPNPFFEVGPVSAGAIVLRAVDASAAPLGIIPAGTDLGFQSIDGLTVASSTAGTAFRADEAFRVAIDYSAAFFDAGTGLSFGFGIGEDRAGVSSGGAAVRTQSGAPVNPFGQGPAGGAATVNDSSTIAFFTPPVCAESSSLSGSLHVIYDPVAGILTTGWGPPGSAAPTSSGDLPVVQFVGGADATRWSGADLAAAFFVRSDLITVPFLPTVSSPWSTGLAEVTFSNVRVVSGADAAFVVSCGGDRNRDGSVDAADIMQVVAELDAPGAETVFFDLLGFLRLFDGPCVR